MTRAGSGTDLSLRALLKDAGLEVDKDVAIIELGLVTGQFIGFGRLVAALDLENPHQPEA